MSKFSKIAKISNRSSNLIYPPIFLLFVSNPLFMTIADIFYFIKFFDPTPFSGRKWKILKFFDFFWGKNSKFWKMREILVYKFNTPYKFYLQHILLRPRLGTFKVTQVRGCPLKWPKHRPSVSFIRIKNLPQKKLVASVKISAPLEAI